jgi:hypothetical protein
LISSVRVNDQIPWPALIQGPNLPDLIIDPVPDLTLARTSQVLWVIPELVHGGP